MLDSLHHSGLSLIVDCDDFNCDVRLLETAYSPPAGSVKVLTAVSISRGPSGGVAARK